MIQQHCAISQLRDIIRADLIKTGLKFTHGWCEPFREVCLKVLLLVTLFNFFFFLLRRLLHFRLLHLGCWYYHFKFIKLLSRVCKHFKVRISVRISFYVRNMDFRLLHLANFHEVGVESLLVCHSILLNINI